MSYGRNTDNTDFNPRFGGDFNTQAGNNQAGYDQSLGGRTAEHHGAPQGSNPDPMSAFGEQTQGDFSSTQRDTDTSRRDFAQSRQGDEYQAGYDQTSGGRSAERHGQAQGSTHPDPVSAFGKQTGTGDSSDYSSSTHHHTSAIPTSTMNPDPMGTSRTTGTKHAGDAGGFSSGAGTGRSGYDTSSGFPDASSQGMGSTDAQYGSSTGRSTFGSGNEIGTGTNYSDTTTGQRGMGSGMEEAQYGTSGRRMEDTGMGHVTGHGGMDKREREMGYEQEKSGMGGMGGMTGSGQGNEYSTSHVGRDTTTGTGMGTSRTADQFGETGAHDTSNTGTGMGIGTGRTGDQFSGQGKDNSTTYTGTGMGTHTGSGTGQGRTGEYGKTGTDAGDAHATGAQKPSMSDKIAGKLEKVAGKVSGNPAMVERGEEKVTGRHVN